MAKLWTLNDFRMRAVRGEFLEDCGCRAGKVSICGRYPCPRRTMDPVLGLMAMPAPPPSMWQRIKEIARNPWLLRQIAL